MARTGKLPRLRLPGDRVDPRALLTRAEVEGPRLGVERVADDQRPDAIAQGLGPQQLAILAGEHGHPPAGEIARKELLPEVAVAVDVEHHQQAAGAHRGQNAAGAEGHVDRLPPEDLAASRIQCDHQADVGLLQRPLGRQPLQRGQVGDLPAPLGEHLLALLRRDVLIDEVQPAVADGDRAVPDRLAGVSPLDLAAL